ncbi:MAG: hypothetical protein FWG98_03920 [Candidatus Cloacimonetes bacterium]|nr:hypothetical protein [Candidatus Cloacimonadota bacterium]
MGSKLLVLIIAAMVVIGGMFVHLSRRQIGAAILSAEQTYSQQARQLANSFAEDGLRRFRADSDMFLNANVGEVRSFPTVTNIEGYVNPVVNVDITKIDDEGNYRLRAVASFDDPMESNTFTGETILEFMGASAYAVYTYQRYLIYVELWNDLYVANQLNGEERLILQSAGLLPEEINCVSGCRPDDDFHPGGCGHSSLFPLLRQTIQNDPDIHERLCPILISNGGISSVSCDILELRTILRDRPQAPNLSALHQQVRTTIWPSGIVHYNSLLKYYDSNNLPPYFHFGETMVHEYDNWANYMENDLRTVTQLISDQTGFEFDMNTHVDQRRRLLEDIEEAFIINSWRESPVSRAR